MTRPSRFTFLTLAAAALLPLPALLVPPYLLYLGVEVAIFAVAFTGWALMARFGLVSLGHGAFFGIGAYAPALLWNLYGLSPWLGVPVGIGLACAFALLIAYPCFRLSVVGHYFALVTLAAGEIVRLGLVAARDLTGGALGLSIRAAAPDQALAALQLSKPVMLCVVLGAWCVGYLVWRAIDASMLSRALHAISDNDQAAAAIGVDVVGAKLKITLVSAAVTALGGGLYAQYKLYINPETVSGIGVSLQIVFASIVGGIHSVFGPALGSALVTALSETLRITFGTALPGAANTIFGLLLILVILRLPRGLLGLRPRRRPRIDPALVEIRS